MPALHRYLGNPVLSFIGRLFFGAPIGDFHCGLRGFERASALGLDLRTPGMEFASELIVNKAKWASLPADLKAVVENACAACNVSGEAWCQKNNAEAMEDLIKNQGVIAQPLPDAIVAALRAANEKILAEAVAKDPVTKKVHDSYMSYMAKYKQWAGYSEAVYHDRILGKG